MDRKQDWKWLPQQMPGVAALIASRRAEMGTEWVNECWKRGVIDREPGWFFAAEGALMVGTPWPGDQQLIDLLAKPVTPTQALLFIRQPEAAHAA